MNTKKVRILLFCVLISVCSCAGARMGIPHNYAGDDAGYVVLSLGASTETAYSSYSLLIRKVDKSAETGVSYLPDNMFRPTKKDFVENDSHGFVSIMKVPAGEYEIFNVDVFENLGLIQTHYRAKNEFSIRFPAKPGTTTYLGKYIAITLGKGLFGTSIGGAYFVVTNEMKRDLELAKKKNPDLFVEKVIDSVPDPERIGSPLIRSKP